MGEVFLASNYTSFLSRSCSIVASYFFHKHKFYVLLEIKFVSLRKLHAKIALFWNTVFSILYIIYDITRLYIVRNIYAIYYYTVYTM